MPADRFYFDGPLIQGASLQLEDPEHHHLSRVMRIAVGEEVDLINGKGAHAKAKVSSIDKRSTTVRLTYVQTASIPQQQIILAVPLMRPNKLELIVEKGTELGADGFWFYPAHFSEKTELSINQLERLRYLAISAMKQSGRLFLPSFELLASLDAMNGFLLFGDTRSDAPSILHLEIQAKTIFITGPERGFSPEEVEQLGKKGKGVKLNTNILRAETAPLAAMSVLSLLLSKSS
ncbi:MAG TPA: RsmE family RNA methyltransferase [Chlamydiales bacterium]|jgi:16S rRNA (uracil1498-N3)-methyltransferase|nr:RsmE family RNA methyltransferase [Chlamydiales bacterium]